MGHPAPSAVEIELTTAERARLHGLTAEASGVARRARIVSFCAERGTSNAQVVGKLGLTVAGGVWAGRMPCRIDPGVGDPSRS